MARVVVVDEQGHQRVYYICRATPVTGAPGLLASYKAPVGRLASLPVGDALTLPNGEVVEVIERTRLRPSKQLDGWDSRDSVFEGETLGPITIESLRGLLRKASTPEDVKNLLGQILADEGATQQIHEGIRRDRITKMSLRDQPVLDQYQDEIFRLPLDQRLLILGPPGTGKTTTLIRRLSQKIDVSAPDSLSEGEQRIIRAVADSGGGAHEGSWLMFTPTELLKQYLKEAFAHESVPASDQRIKTWSDYRRELGRNVLGILRMPGSGGVFTLKDQARTLADSARNKPVAWFEDFDAWQRLTYVQGLQQGVQALADGALPQASSVGTRIARILGEANPANMSSLFVELQAETGALQALVNDLKQASDKRIDDALNLAINRNAKFLDELGQFIDLVQAPAEAETDDDADADGEAEDDDAGLPKTSRGLAIKAFRQAVKAQARAVATKRSIGKASRNALVLEWLGERTLGSTDRASVGTQLVLLAAARRFVNPVKRFLDGVPKRYRSFRRERHEAGTWYSAETFQPTDLHPLELDLVLLSCLRSASALLSRPQIARRITEPFWAALQTVNGLYKNQILVDEATDFSPIQLACMGALAHPQLRSFFACGDFNQRLTTWGSRSVEELNWVFPDIEVRRVNVSYRQSRQLNELARAIIEVLGGDAQIASMPPHVNSNAESPALLEDAMQADAVPWLAEQVRSVAGYLQQLPSTAVFVNNEADVQGLADALNEALEDDNIRVVACPKGQVMGNDNDVRVFDIQHIKGLEFEAVFFVGIDQLARMHPTLFDKYLYVGATRAATYLGVTCEQQLPEAMKALRQHFVAGWST
ncbi:ATP-dependent helicase [Paucibacter sp. DJ4R-1]|nr:ATP-dependent helicase [Paucibacter sp. DJ4R-1]